MQSWRVAASVVAGGVVAAAPAVVRVPERQSPVTHRCPAACPTWQTCLAEALRNLGGGDEAEQDDSEQDEEQQEENKSHLCSTMSVG